MSGNAASPTATRDASCHGRAPAKGRGRPRVGSLTALGPPRAQGRWSLVDRDRRGATPTELAHARAAVLLRMLVTRAAAAMAQG